MPLITASLLLANEANIHHLRLFFSPSRFLSHQVVSRLDLYELFASVDRLMVRLCSPGMLLLLGLFLGLGGQQPLLTLFVCASAVFFSSWKGKQFWDAARTVGRGFIAFNWRILVPNAALAGNAIAKLFAPVMTRPLASPLIPVLFYRLHGMQFANGVSRRACSSRYQPKAGPAESGSRATHAGGFAFRA